MVSGTRQLAPVSPVSGARNGRQKQAPESAQCVINFRLFILKDYIRFSVHVQV